MREPLTEPIQILDLDGCPLAYRLRGEGEPVVFLQGVGVQGDGWRPQADELQARFRCLTIDNRGIGRSVPAGGEITVERMAADTLALLDHLGWESAHVVGHSLGGQIALELALTAPARVRSLSLLCTFARGRDAMALDLGRVWTGLRTFVGTRGMRRRAFLNLVMPRTELRHVDRDDLAEELGELFGHDLADHPPIEMKQLGALRRYDASSRLAELEGIPTLVVSGHEDRIASPASGLALSAGIPGSLYVEIPQAGHGLPIQKSREVNSLLDRHLTAKPSASGPSTLARES
ncbi:MAG: alpha/beta fold hydrolase [Thermoanaerobaculia bacterium]